LWPYAVVQGHADRITEAGALEVMDQLAEFYIGPGQVYPMREVSDGLVVHVVIDRVYGQGPGPKGVTRNRLQRIPHGVSWRCCGASPRTVR
jgi:hypothetical protein